VLIVAYTYIEKIRDGAITLLRRGDSSIVYARFRIKGFKEDGKTCYG